MKRGLIILCLIILLLTGSGCVEETGLKLQSTTKPPTRTVTPTTLATVTQTPVTTTPTPITTPQPELKGSPEPLITEEVKDEKTLPVGGVSITTTPSNISFWLSCSSNYEREGRTPALYEDIPVGDCDLELTYSEKYYGFGTRKSGFIVKEGRIRQQIYDFRDDIRDLELHPPPLKTPPPIPHDWDWNTDIKIGIIEFEPQNIVHETYPIYGGVTFLDLINNPDEFSNFYVGPYDNDTFYSFYYVDDWFKNEYKRITGYDNLSITVDVQGPFKVQDRPHRDYWCSDLIPFFENHSKANNIDISDYDVINYVYFDPDVNWSELDAYGNAAFKSCRVLEENISFIDTEPSIGFRGVVHAVRKVLHESSHVFGGHDTYSGSTCKDPEGMPEPDKDPRFPQTYGCMMCGCRMEKAGAGSCQTPKDITGYVICDKTARDFGWIE